MTACHLQASGAVECFFYGELGPTDRTGFERHLTVCSECRRALEEMSVIRAALGSCPQVDAPPGGDWSGFMTRLEAAVRAETVTPAIATQTGVPGGRRRWIAGAAAAAVLALVTIAVSMLMREAAAPGDSTATTASAGSPAPAPADPAEPVDRAAMDAALASVTEDHFKRSKLVVLGLATKDPAEDTAADWEYERGLATSLLHDTRLYRQTAEERGMTSLADVMRDLEIVLLQTSMSPQRDAESLAQLQKLIRRRDLITKMDVVTTTGMLP